MNESKELAELLETATPDRVTTVVNKVRSSAISRSERCAAIARC